MEDLTKRFNDQPCWHCTEFSRCSWGSSLQPVDGWEAEPVFRNEPVMINGRRHRIRRETSVRIIRCPEFNYDDYEPAPLTRGKYNRKTVRGGQWARSWYIYTYMQKTMRTEMAKKIATSRFYDLRPRIPWSVLDAYVKEHKLTPSQTAMTFTGTYNYSTISFWKRRGVRPTATFYERIVELTGFDVIANDPFMNYLEDEDGLLRLSRSKPPHKKS